MSDDAVSCEIDINDVARCLLCQSKNEKSTLNVLCALLIEKIQIGPKNRSTSIATTVILMPHKVC